jgi:hypothetical protein
MAKRVFPNGGASYVNAAATNTATTITVLDGTQFYNPAAGEEYTVRCGNEYMLVTAVSENNLTVTRGQQGSTAVAISVGALIFVCLTGEDLRRVPVWDVNSSNVGNRRGLNLIPGSGIALSGADDSANDRVGVTVTLQVDTVAGAPTGTPANGTMKLDTTNNRLYIYNGGWKYAALT